MLGQALRTLITMVGKLESWAKTLLAKKEVAARAVERVAKDFIIEYGSCSTRGRLN